MSSGHKSYLLAVETEQDFKDWLIKLSSVLQQNKLQEEKRAASLERGREKCIIEKCFLSHCDCEYYYVKKNGLNI